MIRSLFSSVSGLKTHQTRMDVIGNNIANVNTTGFKSSRATFSDTLYQTMTGASSPDGAMRGGTNPKQVGLGVGLAGIDTIFTDASAQQTGVNTDLALSGNGLFVVKQGNETYYTRDGSFSFDEEGNYVLPGSGKYVQGWTADENGTMKTNETPDKITVDSNKPMAPKETDTITFKGNVALGKLSVPLTVYDSEGGMSQVYINLEKTATIGNVKNVDNTWEVKLVSPATRGDGVTATPSFETIDNTATPPTITAIQGSFYVKFKTDGSYDGVYDSANTRITTTPGLKMTYTSSGKGIPANKDITIDFHALTQYSDPKAEKGATSSDANTAYAHTNGYASGTLTSVSVDSSGIITGAYSNGEMRNLAQVAVARFTNAAGLTRVGGNLFQLSNNSGEANIKTAAALGCTITPSALEMSNVDLANEFSNMIVTQRGYQANSKMITVSDEMLETLINTKR
ncbi:flagellar hook protein FlgE [uncultured Selenomonas sp.]|uniref:flagellar hook protein FlgE n=1 Tax=uncultured Selenomonas sp. TaxID=159275 RepID=UPI0025CCCD8D|nr:flagellar hook protein FlgE [uncultured Selenomonas sp.]